MGLMDIEGADPEEYPDNKGGRPPKEEEDEGEDKRKANVDDPWMGKRGDEYWQDMWDEHNGFNKDILEVVNDIVHHSATSPSEVIKHLHRIEVFDFTDYDETPHSEEYLIRSGILDTKEAKQDQVMSIFGGGGESDEEEKGDENDTEISSGLSGLIND